MTLDPRAVLLDDRVAVVTGAAMGIGEGIARSFARFGARLAVCDRDGERLAAVAKSLEADGVEVVSGSFDLRDEPPLRAFFDAARRNLGAGGGDLGLGGPTASGLLFAESHGVDAFGRFADEAAGAPDTGGGWHFRQTGEDNSLWAVPNAEGSENAENTGRLLLVAGRQLVTKEGLEVLALGCRDLLTDGMALREARDAVIEAGGVPVVPWGFGKWWFRRGRVLSELIDSESPGRWFLGDNAGRPKLSLPPRLFARAAQRGVFVLPGSDPLPLAGQDRKVGRCGFRLPPGFDPARPAASVLDGMRECREQPQTFGRYEGLAGFARQQLAMQMRKRVSEPAAGASS